MVVKILVLPREDGNPYQALLYGEMGRRGVRVRYVGRRTPSHTVSLLILPMELAALRLMGWRVIHLHWVFCFALAGSTRFPALRRLSQEWFAIWLRIVRLLGMRLVWTAHNVLPHEPVFADDVAARRLLVARSDLVIAHSRAALDELAKLGAVPRRSAVIPHGPFAAVIPAASLRVPGTGEGPRRFLLFGTVREYKGAEELLAAFAAIPADVPAHLTVAGECADARLRSVLGRFAGHCGGRVALRLGRVPDGEVAGLLAAADAVVLPFRQVTTSGSALLALGHGRPLVVPDLAGLAELPDGAVVRYDGTVPGLAAALVRVALADAEVLAAMSAAARDYSSAITWGEIAQATIETMTRILGGRPRAGTADQPAGIT
jgi:glycosyltransferase involved in cell wall biosynthesis